MDEKTNGEIGVDQGEKINRAKQLLSAERLEENEYKVTSSVIEPPPEKIAQKPLKITFFTVLFSALSLRRTVGTDPRIRAVRPVKTLKSLVLIIVLSVLFLLLFDFVDGKLMLPVIVGFCSVAMPVLLITLNYELCPKKKVSSMQIISTFCIGALLYAAIYAVTNGLLVRYIYQSTIDAIIIPALWGLTELFALLIIVKIYSITDLPSCILIAVCIGMGFCFSRSLLRNFTALFTSIEVISSSRSPYNGLGILDDPEFMKNSVNQMLAIVPWTGVYYPVMFACWSVVIGNVASSDGRLKSGGKKERPVSIYLMLVMVIVTYMLCEFQTSFGGFDIILKLFCALISLMAAIRQLNVSISRSLDSSEN